MPPVPQGEARTGKGYISQEIGGYSCRMLSPLRLSKHSPKSQKN
jgi:hypothetical protein